MAAGVCLAATAGAQLIGPIPPATPPTPEYVPPEKRDVPPAQVEVPEVEPPAPSIVEKSESGKLKPLKGTAEEAAVAAYKLDAPRRERVERVAAARKLDLDRFVVQNLDKVLAARKMREKVENASAFDELFAARDVVVALRFERLIDRLEREKAITMAQRVRLDETLLGYDKARKGEIDAAAGNDPTRSAILNLRQTFFDSTGEVFESLHRQMRDVYTHWGQVREVLKLRPVQLEEMERLKESHTAPQQAQLEERFLCETLDLEQQRAAMTARLASRSARPEK